jgi:hypothetical protein
VSDAPDWQKVVTLVASPMSDSPDWQTTVVGPGGTPVGGLNPNTTVGVGPTQVLAPGASALIFNLLLNGSGFTQSPTALVVVIAQVPFNAVGPGWFGANGVWALSGSGGFVGADSGAGDGLYVPGAFTPAGGGGFVAVNAFNGYDDTTQVTLECVADPSNSGDIYLGPGGTAAAYAATIVAYQGSA